MAQVIDDWHVPAIEIVGWGINYDEYEDLDLATLFRSKFDEDYLSTDLHVLEWGKLLRLREKGVASGCCVNDTITMRAKKPGERTEHIDEACKRCIRKKRLCARLEQVDELIALVFCHLPPQYRGDAEVNSLGYWVRE